MNEEFDGADFVFWYFACAAIYVAAGVATYFVVRALGERSHRMAIEIAISCPVSVPILIMFAVIDLFARLPASIGTRWERWKNP